MKGGGAPLAQAAIAERSTIPGAVGDGRSGVLL